MKRLLLLLFAAVYFSVGTVQGCMQQQVVKELTPNMERETTITPKRTMDVVRDPIDLALFHRNPTEWGEKVAGVKTRIKTNERKMALTFDACGGAHGNAIDKELLLFLREQNIPATLFMNERWIQANETLFMELATNPLFQLENHGTHHVPLSVNGGEAWGIQATSSPQEVHDEIMQNHETVSALIDKKMTLFRSGTAYYDEVSVQIANELGYEVVNFDVLGDAGATYSSAQVKAALLTAQNGSIALMHINQPQSGTAEGVKQAVPLLLEQDFEFVLLENEVLE